MEHHRILCFLLRFDTQSHGLQSERTCSRVNLVTRTVNAGEILSSATEK